MIKWFYIEDNQPDNDPATSEGMYVYKKDANVAVGDLIQVDGVVEEYVGPGYAERFETDLTTTEIKASRVAVIAKIKLYQHRLYLEKMA